MYCAAYRNIAGNHATEGRDTGATWCMWSMERVGSEARAYRDRGATGRGSARVVMYGVSVSDRQQSHRARSAPRRRRRCCGEYRAGDNETRAPRPPSAGDMMPSARRLCARIHRRRIMPPYPMSSYRVIRYGWISCLTLSVCTIDT